MSTKRIKVLIAKIGLDGHDRGAKLLCRYLRDAGMEVIYTGLRQTSTSIVRIAVQEDVDLIGISILSGAHKTLIASLMDELISNDIEIPVIVGGIVPEKDVQFLMAKGVKKIYSPGTSLTQIHKDIECYAGQPTRQSD